MAGNPRDAFRTGFPAVVYHHISLAQYWGPSCLHILYSPNSTRLFRMPHDANSHNRKLVSFEQLLDRYFFAVGSPTHSQGVLTMAMVFFSINCHTSAGKDETWLTTSHMFVNEQRPRYLPSRGAIVRA